MGNLVLSKTKTVIIVFFMLLLLTTTNRLTTKQVINHPLVSYQYPQESIELINYNPNYYLIKKEQ